ncbi:hypothetical protein D3C80_578040 [compost metagenome]
MYGLGDTTPVIGRQMIEQGLAGKIPVIGDGEFNAANTIKAAPQAMEGAIQAIFWLPSLQTERSLNFVENYKKEYGGEQPNNHAYSSLGEHPPAGRSHEGCQKQLSRDRSRRTQDYKV